MDSLSMRIYFEKVYNQNSGMSAIFIIKNPFETDTNKLKTMNRVRYLLHLHYNDHDATVMLKAFHDAGDGVTSVILESFGIMSPEEAVARYELKTSLSTMSICVDMMEASGQIVKYRQRDAAAIETCAAKLGVQISNISSACWSVSYIHDGCAVNRPGNLRSIDEDIMSSVLGDKWMIVRTAYLQGL
jgi:hypothetical protein